MIKICIFHLLRSSDNEKLEYSNKAKAFYDIKKIEKNRKIKHLNENVQDEENNKKILKSSQLSQSKLGVKSNLISSGTINFNLESSRKK